MHKDLEKILFDEKSLEGAVRELGEKITRDYEGRDLVCVCILKGSIIFFSDLIRNIRSDGLTLDFMTVSSYGSSAVSSGQISVKKDLSSDIRGRDVLIVEDIVDTGNTLSFLRDHLRERQPRSVRICTLFDKPSRRVRELHCDYSCFTIDDHFIVGYGLDYNEKYRNLPYVGILKPEIYQ